MKYWALLGFLLLLGCGSGKSDSQAGSGEVVTGSEDSLGQFKSESELKPEDNMYTVGCANPGQSQSLPQLDGRLKVGQIQIQRFRALTQDGKVVGLGFQGDLVALKKTGRGGTKSEEITLNEVVNIPQISQGLKFREDCSVSEDGNEGCTTTPPLPNFNIPFANCTIDNPTSQQGKAFKGTFQFAAGGSVPAFDIRGSMKGKLTCDGGISEEGEFTYHMVRSNEVPSRETKYCGGVSLFLTLKARTNSGKIKSWVWSEMLRGF